MFCVLSRICDFLWVGSGLNWYFSMMVLSLGC